MEKILSRTEHFVTQKMSTQPMSTFLRTVFRPIVRSLVRWSERTISVLLGNQLLLALLLLAIVPMLGTTGYVLIERWNLFDALYMTIITMATIGFGEVHPLSHAGRAFTMAFIVVGTGIVAYALTIVVEAILQPEFITKRILHRKLRTMEQHYIVCGFGRAGARIAQELRTAEKSFVVIDMNEIAIKTFRTHGGIALVGDATDEGVLHEAGISRAKGLVTSLPTDAANIFVALTARGLNPSLYIVARAEQSTAKSKLLRAGANAVLSPQEIGAVRMTQMLLQENIVDAFEIVTRTNTLDLAVEEFSVRDFPVWWGKSITALQFPERFRVVILAVKNADESVQFPALPETLIESSMTLILTGENEQLARLQREMRT
ncbi:MAG: potassium channel protein [Candidatus Kapaibacterium sp.]|nr:MAG: potassium channel protein [Candidatus Kapabacteria bacterium]